MTAPRRPRFDLRESAGTVLVAIALAFAVNVLFALVFIRPQREKVRVLEEDSTPTLERVEGRRREVDTLEVYVRHLVEARTNLARLRDDVLSTRERKMIETQVEVARIAERFGTTFDRMQFENDILEDEGLDRFGIVVPLSGGYANLRKFIQAVESSERFLVIERVALQQGDDGGSLLQLNITLATYFVGPNAPGASPASPAPPSAPPRPAGSAAPGEERI